MNAPLPPVDPTGVVPIVVEPTAVAVSSNGTLVWFASVRIRGVHAGVAFSELHDYGEACFATATEAEAYAAERASARVRALLAADASPPCDASSAVGTTQHRAE